MLHGIDEDIVFLELVLRDRLADADDVLIHHPPCADVEMSDFGISHLAGGQTHRESRRFERGPRRLAEQTIEMRRLRLSDRVPLFFFATAEAVEDDQDEKGTRHSASLRDLLLALEHHPDMVRRARLEV